ncbi:PREDICTED: HRAS-like suppressor 2, partial [Myotis brandtii]|uniref:HRAS-like suppressor 2 n=1 Tax=Myotis brandtii TaxID=109478 RepID=UPI0007047479
RAAPGVCALYPLPLLHLSGTSEPTGAFRRIHILGFRNEEPESRGSCDFSKGIQAGVGLCLSLKPGRGPAFPQLILTDEAQGSGAACLPALSPNHRPLSSLGTTGDIMGAVLAKLMVSRSDKAIVKKELLSVVAGKDRYRVNNKHDRKYSPLSPSKIVHRAEEKVGQEMLYKLTSDNCEHFVNELRYGVSRSDQVTEAVVAGGVAVGLLGVGLVIAALIGSLRGRREREEQ